MFAKLFYFKYLNALKYFFDDMNLKSKLKIFNLPFSFISLLNTRKFLFKYFVLNE